MRTQDESAYCAHSKPNDFDKNVSFHQFIPTSALAVIDKKGQKGTDNGGKKAHTRLHPQLIKTGFLCEATEMSEVIHVIKKTVC